MPSEPTVLVVDDDYETRIHLFDLLEAEGYHVITARNAYEALESVSREIPEVIITDVRMPLMDGIELTRRIRKLSRKTRIVVLTAYGDHRMYERARRHGADDLIFKPCDNEELLASVRGERYHL